MKTATDDIAKARYLIANEPLLTESMMCMR